MDMLSFGMLTAASIDHRRIYVGRCGVELVGFRSETSRLRPLWLWMRGYLQRDGRIDLRTYGSPGFYLTLSPKGRAFAEKIKNDAIRWKGAHP